MKSILVAGFHLFCCVAALLIGIKEAFFGDFDRALLWLILTFVVIPSLDAAIDKMNKEHGYKP